MMRPSPDSVLVGRHLRVGWLLLAISASLGLGLETLHGFKVAWYVAVSNETRRLMWTLAHAHGTLLGLVNIAFAASTRLRGVPPAARARYASRCLLAASVVLPGGFFLGGCFVYEGDPGIGVALVPVGGVLLIVALAMAV